MIKESILKNLDSFDLKYIKRQKVKLAAGSFVSKEVKQCISIEVGLTKVSDLS